MAYTTINKGSNHFNTVLYTGNATDNRTVTGVGFQPDWVWIKDRTNANHHRAYDSVRGANKLVIPSLGYDEETRTDGVKSFDSDGFTLGTGSDENGNSANFVSWNWKSATSFSNSAGSNGADLACTGKVNTTAGFSIIKATSDSAANKTIAHGLGAVPDVIWARNLDSNYNWDCYFKVLGYNASLILNATNTTRTGAWGSNAFTTTTFNTQENYSSTNGEAYI